MTWRLFLSATRTNITNDAIVTAVSTCVNLMIETEIPCACVMHDVYQSMQGIEVLPRVTLTFNVCYMRLFQLFRACVGLSLLSYVLSKALRKVSLSSLSIYVLLFVVILTADTLVSTPLEEHIIICILLLGTVSAAIHCWTVAFLSQRIRLCLFN